MGELQAKRQPGDLIIDRYMPNATSAEREAARENLHAFVDAMVRIATRRANDEYETLIRAKRDGAVESESGTQPPL